MFPRCKTEVVVDREQSGLIFPRSALYMVAELLRKDWRSQSIIHIFKHEKKFKTGLSLVGNET